jgi:hypothetical protein
VAIHANEQQHHPFERELLCNDLAGVDPSTS